MHVMDPTIVAYRSNGGCSARSQQSRFMSDVEEWTYVSYASAMLQVHFVSIESREMEIHTWVLIR